MRPARSSFGSALAGRYTIERELGRGGTATVYLALEEKHGRHVAIKALAPEVATSLGAERFLREIRIAAQLSHPHLVPLIDSGEADGVLYYVAPYVSGGSLRDRLEKYGRLPVAEAIRIVSEVGAGLDYVHRNGLVHRDVKPENILFADEHAMLADFGIAQGGRPAGTEPLTEAGLAVGTPEYMSPEQASGDPNLDGRSDVYSLACVLYEMVGGEPPLRGTSAHATMAKHVTEAPRPIRTLRPDAPPALERALARALAKDPADRFANVADFLAALRREDLDGHRAPRVAVRSIGVLPFVNASSDSENEYLSDGITDELIDALAKVEGLRVASRTSVFALKGTPQDVRAIGAQLGVSEVLEGTVRKAGSRLRITAQLTSTDDGRLLWSQRYDRTLDDVFAIQDEIARTIVNTLLATSLDVAEPLAKRYTENVTAYGWYLKGRYAWNKRSREGVAEAIQYFERAIQEDAGYAAAYAGLADSYALHVDYRDVPVHEGFERAKGYAKTALELDDSLAEGHASLAWSLFIYDWDWRAADREFRRAVELNPRYATAHQWYAFLLAVGGRLDAALAEGHAALELDPASVSVRRSMGWLYYYARSYGQARNHLARAIAMNPIAEESYRVLGLALAQQGVSHEAERVLREALLLPGASTYSAATLGYVLGRAGRREEARQILEEVGEVGRRGYVSPIAFAMLYLGLGDSARALDAMERAYEERRGWMAYLTINPVVDPLRDEPRFRELVAKMRLNGFATSPRGPTTSRGQG